MRSNEALKIAGTLPNTGNTEKTLAELLQLSAFVTCSFSDFLTKKLRKLCAAFAVFFFSASS
jgi:hypothetical protein